VSKIVLGDAAGKALKIDLDVLITTRLLIQANSGGGKSWLLRRLAEQFFGKVQTIIIDPEGEFSTLREKFGYVLVGEGGETPADVRSAAMLAEKLLTLKASAICDVYEAFRSRPLDRRQWVRHFLNALLDAPRSLWHPLIVIVDEAHKFCPQETPKAGNQLDREIIGGCKDAMISLSTTGRKRGFCPIWATQRLAKLDKDASAEFFNRLVGMTIEDVDVDRAADLMSVSKEDKHDFRTSLRNLAPGQFYAFGRAITTERVLVTVGDVETKHPESGNAKASVAPPTPEEVKAFLPQLADLPKEADDRAKSLAELQRENKALKQQVKAAEKGVPKPVTVAAKVDPKATERAVREATTPLRKQLEAIQRGAKEVCGYLYKANVKLGEIASLELPKLEPLKLLPQEQWPKPAQTKERAIPVRPAREVAESNGDPSLQRGPLAVLKAVAQYPDGAARDQITVLTGYKRSTRDAYLLRLAQCGYVTEGGNGMQVTEHGIAALGANFEPLPVGDELREYWRNRLPEGERKIFEVLVENYPDSVSKDKISDLTGYKRSTRDAYLQRMASKRLVEDAGRAAARASDNLFDGAA